MLYTILIPIAAFALFGSSRHLVVGADSVSAPGLIVYRFGADVFYANATRLAEEVMGLVNVEKPPRWFVLDADGIDDLDFTAGKTLAELVDHLTERGIVFAVAEVHARVKRQLDLFGVTAKIGEEHVYTTVQDAVEAFEKSG